MKAHEGFLRSIIEAPEDDAPRLVYSDWLEEHGDLARAEFIRVQCRLAGHDADDPQYRELQRREYELLAENWGTWAGPLVGRVSRWRFRRGFVEQVKLTAKQFLEEAKWLLDFAPIRELHVEFPEVEEVRALVASDHIKRITRLNLDHAGLGDAGVMLLAEAPKLAGLRELSLRFTKLGVDGLTALAGSPHLRSLRALDVTANRLPQSTFGPFVAACRLPDLERLDWDRAIGLDDIRALLSSPLPGQLTWLSLRERPEEGVRLLAESSAFPRLTTLTLRSGTISGAAAGWLARSPLLSDLRSLSLRTVGLGDEGVALLARSAQAPLLRQLDLGFNPVGPEGARALADSPLCDELTRLDLSGNPIGDEGVKAVMHSPHLRNLRRLDLHKCAITEDGAETLLTSPHLDRLTCLQLEQNEIGRPAFNPLQARIGERLYHEHQGDGLDTPEVVRRVSAEPPRCLCGLGAKSDTELLRRFPRQRFSPKEYACVAFELTHPDPEQKAVLLGYEDGRAIFFSPYAIRWEPSGEQREFFDAEQHGHSAEFDSNSTIVGSGERVPWGCGRRGCRDHTFLVTFTYRLESPPRRYPDRYLPFADQFYLFDLDVYCAAQDELFEIATFECK